MSLIRLAQASKFTMLVLYPAWALLSVFAYHRRHDGNPPGPPGYLALRLLAVFLVSLAVLNSLYLFDGTFSALGDYQFKSRLLTGRSTNDIGEVSHGNRYRNTVLSGLPVPLPRDYVRGFDSQKWEAEIGLTNVRDGRTIRGGMWYSPIRILLFKLPVGTLLLFCLSIAMAPFTRPAWPCSWTLWLPAAVLLGALCCETGLNWPVRYSLPALPLLAVASGQLVSRLVEHRLGRWLILACLLGNASETISIAPHFLSFSNALVGGLGAAQRNLHGSNYDWGQDLELLRRWRDEHPSMKPLVTSYFGAVSPGFAGIQEQSLPASFYAGPRSDPGREDAADRSFYWAVSSNYLNGVNGYYLLSDGSRVIATIRPGLLSPENAIARAGYTIYVFEISADTGRTTTGPRLHPRDLEGCLLPLRDVRFGPDAVP